MPATVPSICRFCHAGCAILVDVEDGRPLRVRGDRDNPAYRGFCCVKGQQLLDQWGHPDRLLQSMKRMPDGSHRPVRYVEAVDEIAERLSEILVTHGPRAVAMYSGTYSIANPATMPLALSLMEAIGSPMHFTSNSIDQPGKAVAQALHGTWMAPPPAFDTRDVALLVGTNPPATMAGGLPLANPGRELTDAVGRGMRFIVIDPRRTDIARRAHLHLQCRPGEDVPLLAAMLNVILREARHDAAFVRDHVDGLEALRAAVAPFEPEWVARRADVRVEDLVQAARLFAGGRGVATAGTGPNFNGRGTLFEYLLLALNTVCGQWSRAGEPVPNPGTLSPPFPAIAQAAPPRAGYGYGEKLRVRGLANCDGGLQASALAEEILLEGEGQVRALISIGGNPASAIPDQALNVRALEQLDLLVHVDIKRSATARLADFVIAPKLPIEMPGMTLVQDQLTFYGAGFGHRVAHAQYTPRSPSRRPAPRSSRSGSSSTTSLAGWDSRSRSPRRPRRARRPTARSASLDMTQRPTHDALFAILTRNARVPLEEVKRHPHGAFFPRRRSSSPNARPAGPDASTSATPRCSRTSPPSLQRGTSSTSPGATLSPHLPPHDPHLQLERSGPRGPAEPLALQPGVHASRRPRSRRPREGRPRRDRVEVGLDPRHRRARRDVADGPRLDGPLLRRPAGSAGQARPRAGDESGAAAARRSGRGSLHGPAAHEQRAGARAGGGARRLIGRDAPDGLRAPSPDRAARLRHAPCAGRARRPAARRPGSRPRRPRRPSPSARARASRTSRGRARRRRGCGRRR
ncbi:MAG: molybdopterin-dependent oxidoreductase [Myxococcota bacterium]